MRLLSTLASIVLLTGAPPAMAQETIYYSHGYDDDIRQQIERNWNVDTAAIEACSRPVELRVFLAEDRSGKVTKVDILPGDPESDACKAVAESARRAVLISSPLKLPADNQLSSLKLRFDPNIWED